MSKTSGMARELSSPRSGLKFSNLTEFRGTIVDALTDYFFGHAAADVDWNNVTDEARWQKWILSRDIPVDGPQESDLVVQTDTHHGRVEHIAGNGVATSNLRELWTYPESATWGIAHAVTEITSSDMWGVTEDGLVLNPQHGLALRCQEDTKRRGIICWHDATFGIPYIINIGVWDCNLDDTGFHNHQTNMWYTGVPETYVPISAVRQSGNAIVTVATHQYQVGDVVQCQFALTPSQAGIVVNRASNFVTANVGTHTYVVGDLVDVTAGSPATFNGTRFSITSVVPNVSITWAQTAGNGAGTATVAANHRVNGQVTAVTATTVTLPDNGNDRTYPIDAPSFISRIFPYMMEVRVVGLSVTCKAWGRHEAVPAWSDPNRSCTVNLAAATQSGIAFTNAVRTGGVATVTLGPHNFITGERIGSIACAGNTTFQEPGSPFGGGVPVKNVTATTISYDNPGSDVAPTGPSGTFSRLGSGSTADIRDHPAPVGSGRIGFVAAHTGTDDRSACVYGPFTGTNSYDNDLTAMSAVPAVEHETVLPITAIRTWRGTGTGVFGFAGAAVGIPRVRGVATGVFGGTFTANGVGVTPGLGAGVFGFTAVAVGAARSLGVALGSFGFTGTAAGTARAVGVGTGPFGFEGSATGRPIVHGAAAGILGFTGTATGAPRLQGSAAGVFGLVAAATGVRRIQGTATGLFGFTGTAAGVVDTPAVTGTATGVFGGSGTAAGRVQVFGLAVAAFGFTGTGFGVRRVGGLATGVFGFTGLGFGAPRHLGQATGTFGYVGAAGGVARVHAAGSGLFGFTGTAAGIIPADAVTGSGTGVFGFTGTAVGVPRVSGAAVGTFGYSGLAAGTARATGVGSGLYGFTATATGKVTVHGQATGLFGALFSGSGFVGQLVTPPERTISINAESRTSTVPAEQRTLTFASETRMLVAT